MISRRRSLKIIAGSAVGAVTLGVFPQLNAQASSGQGENNRSKEIKIGVIGAGWLGGTVGRCLVQAGYEVMFAARDLDKVRRDIRGLGDKAKVGTPAQAAQFGNVLLFALPHAALAQVATELQAYTQGKIIMDATNTNGDDPEVMAKANGNVALFNAQFFPNAYVVRAFSSVDATQIEASFKRGGRNPLAVPIASDNSQALSLVAQLVQAIHCSPVSVGKLENAILFQRGTPAFRRHVNESELRRILQIYPDSARRGLTKRVIEYI